MNLRPLLLATSAAFAALMAHDGVTATTSWKGSPNANWSASANWTSGTPGAGDTASFDSNFTGANQPNVNGSTTLGQILAASSLAKNVTITTGTNTLTLSGVGGVAINAQQTANSLTIAGRIEFEGAQTIAVNNGSAAIDLDITANVIDKWYTSITKTGTGTMRLSGNNTFQGPLTISNGIVIAASNNALGASTWNNSIANGAALHLTGGITVNEGSFQVRGTGPDGQGAMVALSGANIFNGTLTVSQNATVGANSGASLAFTGDIDLANNLTFAGAGNFNASGQIYGSGVFTKTGSGTLQFSGGSHNINGTRLDVLEGTVELNRAGKHLNTTQGPIVGTTSGPAATLKLLTNQQIRDDLFVDVRESGTFDLNGFNESVAGLRLTGGNVQTGAGTLTIANAGGDEIHSYASTQTATLSGKLTSALAQGVTITTDNGAAAVDLNISAAISGSAVKWTKKGTGTLEYSGTQANTFTGQTIIDAGTLRLNKSSGVDAISGSSVRVNSGGTLQLANSNQIKNSTTMILDGGTFSTGATTGFSEKLGTLTLSSNSTIDLGTGIHLLEFSNSSSIAWNGTLTIYDWVGSPSGGTQGRIFFGNNASGLTSAQLAQISFDGFGPGAILLSSGELVPIAIPEAETIFAALALGGLFLWRERRRLRTIFLSVRRARA